MNDNFFITGFLFHCLDHENIKLNKKQTLD